MKRLIKAFGYSCSGLAQCYREDTAFRQEVWLAAIVIPLGWWLGEDWTEKALLIGPILLVMIVELLNSAIEALADIVSPEFHPLVKKAKDAGSAAVLISLLLLGLCWLFALVA